MDPNVKPQELARQAAEAQVQETRATEEARCSSCGSPLEADAIFCPECGAARSSGPRQCPACGAEADGLYCPSCGIEVQEKPCPSCGVVVYGDFCPHCGTSLSPVGDEALRMGTEELAVEEMSEAEAVRIEKSLAEAKSPDGRRFQEIMEQRRIVRKEKAYFQERENRILEFQTRSGQKVILQSKEDLEMLRNAQQSLSGYIQRKKEREEEQRRRREEEERQKRLEAEVRLKADREHQEALERIRRLEQSQRERNEALRRQEEQRQRAELEARKQFERRREAERAELRRKQFANRISGVYYWSYGNVEEILRLNLVNGRIEGENTFRRPNLKAIARVEGNYNGSQITLQSVSIRVSYIAPGFRTIGFRYAGRVSEDGETLTLLLTNIPRDGVCAQEVFIRQ